MAYDLIAKRRVSKSRYGYTVRYNVAVARQAYATDRCVAWKGRFSNPTAIYWQHDGQTVAEFRQEAERYFALP